MLDRADVQVRYARLLAVELQAVQQGRHHAEEGAQLPAGQVHAQAEVGAVSEGKVVVGRALDVEAVRIGELALVPVG